MDRNYSVRQKKIGRLLSLSARRAWIEIFSRRLIHHQSAVALRKESVDRNCPTCQWRRSVKVALRKESVDRNGAGNWLCVMNLLSLSARRAWIEIMVSTTIITTCTVALRKESVDRNVISLAVLLSSTVALRKESVDRNTLSKNPMIGIDSRSPQGERG